MQEGRSIASEPLTARTKAAEPAALGAPQLLSSTQTTLGLQWAPAAEAEDVHYEAELRDETHSASTSNGNASWHTVHKAGLAASHRL